MNAYNVIVDINFLQVYAEELKGGNEIVNLTFRATNLDNKVPCYVFTIHTCTELNSNCYLD